MAALPYMQLYVADYLADTAHLSAVEHGAYLLLMFNYWQRGESFKAKDEQTLNKRLASVARLSNDEWENVCETLAEFFETSENEWLHPRIERDLKAVNAKSEKAKAAGKASAARRSSERPTSVERTLNHTDTDTDENIKEPPIPPSGGLAGPEASEKKKQPKRDEPSQEFLLAWNSYPKRDGPNPRKTAWDAWKARIRAGTDPSELLAGVKRYAAWIEDKGQSGTRFVMMASTFFGPGEHWREEYAPAKTDENWWSDAGFASRFEAENAGCNQFIASQFRNRQRLEAHA